jgi:hypothetical protein
VAAPAEHVASRLRCRVLLAFSQERLARTTRCSSVSPSRDSDLTGADSPLPSCSGRAAARAVAVCSTRSLLLRIVCGNLLRNSSTRRLSGPAATRSEWRACSGRVLLGRRPGSQPQRPLPPAPSPRFSPLPLAPSGAPAPGAFLLQRQQRVRATVPRARCGGAYSLPDCLHLLHPPAATQLSTVHPVGDTAAAARCNVIALAAVASRHTK